VKLKVYSAVIGSVIVGGLFAFGDHLPDFAQNLLIPGFILGLLINGSLHDRMMPYLIFGFLFNWILYSAVTYLIVRFFARRISSR
jgi:hypothetical protein